MPPKTIAVTGSASGIGAATVEHLTRLGRRVIGIDLHDADVLCDLTESAQRTEAVARVGELCEGRLDGLVACAGIGGDTTSQGGKLVSVNYFGTVDIISGLRPALVAAGNAAVVCVSSNSTTCQPNWPLEVAEACLAGDEEHARKLGEGHQSVAVYPATKAAIAWWVRTNGPSADWIGAGIRVNAVAPGVVETPLLEMQRKDPVIGSAIDSFPVPRGFAGRPQEIADVIGFLLGDASRYMVGSIVFADGGTDAQLRPRDWPSVWSL